MHRRSILLASLAGVVLLSMRAYPLELIAHRGGTPSQAENSITAFAQAVPYADAIETDIRFTRDHVPVILHDRTLDRTTNCQGLLSEKSWQQVRACRLHSPTGSLSPQTLPSLSRLLHFHKLRHSPLVLEIKDDDQVGINRVMKSIRGRRNIRLSSFSLTILNYLHRHYHFAELYLISGTFPRSYPAYLRGLFLCTSPTTQDRLHRLPKHLKIYLWTVNRLRDLTRYRHLPVAGVITDRVRYFRKKL